MSDPFSCLPMPLPLEILKYTEDLPTLHHILQVSRGANTIFVKYSHEIVEAIISRLGPCLQQPIRTIVHVRTDVAELHALWIDLINSEDFPETNFDNFLLKFKEYFVDIIYSKIAFKVSRPLTRETASQVAVRSLVNTAADIQYLCAAVLGRLLDRINNVQPQTLQDPGYRYRLKRSFHRRKNDNPRGCTYEIPKFSHASWSEEQRVLRALWHIETFNDFVKIAKPKEGEDNRVWSFLKEQKPHCMWEHANDFKLNEMDDVYRVTYRSSPPLLASSDERHRLWEPPEVNTKSVVLPRRLLHEERKADHELYSLSDSFRLKDRQKSEKPSRGHSIFVMLRTTPASPLYRSDITPLRNLGLGIWDTEKLVKLGLVQDPSLHMPTVITIGKDGRAPKGYLRMDDQIFRWSSLVKGLFDNEADRDRHQEVMTQ